MPLSHLQMNLGPHQLCYADSWGRVMPARQASLRSAFTAGVPRGWQVWLQALGLELGEGGGGSGGAQKLLDRALNTLPSRKHIKVAHPLALRV